jgi:uncharacterized protein (TIGR02301 family)
MRWRKIVIIVIVTFAISPLVPTLAIDPPYQQQMERLSEILGSLYFLQPLCGYAEEDWRAQAADLINLDEPDKARRERLTSAFNSGYQNYARLYRACTPSAQTAMERLVIEAEQSAREIHTRFAE